VKNRIASIYLHRGEGEAFQIMLHNQSDRSSDGIIADANNLLAKSSETAPKEGGYHKVDVTVTWDDGDHLAFTYGMKHQSAEGYTTFADDLSHTLRFHGGLLTDEELKAYQGFPNGRYDYDEYLNEVLGAQHEELRALYAARFATLSA
jgi:hypothetical protein